MHLYKFMLTTVYCTLMLWLFLLESDQYRELASHLEVPLGYSTIRVLGLLGLIPGIVVLLKIIDNEMTVSHNEF